MLLPTLVIYFKEGAVLLSFKEQPRMNTGFGYKMNEKQLLIPTLCTVTARYLGITELTGSVSLQFV